MIGNEILILEVDIPTGNIVWGWAFGIGGILVKVAGVEDRTDRGDDGRLQLACLQGIPIEALKPPAGNGVNDQG